jgi:hypothetical protein
MSALASRADVDGWMGDIRKVPILLQKSVETGRKP